MNKDLSIIIPCYNEEKNISIILKKINLLQKKHNFFEIIMVDNGSTDNTKKIIKNSPLIKSNNIKLVEVSKNIGYGNGIIQGLNSSKTNILAWTHADLQTDLEDVIKAYKVCKNKINNKNILIKGKRINRNFFDNFFTFCMSVLSSIIIGRKIFDINAQPKIFHKKLFEKMKNPPNDFMIDLYLMILAKKNNYDIFEFPVYFNKRQYGKAKGGGTIKGKIKLSLITIQYIFSSKWK